MKKVPTIVQVTEKITGAVFRRVVPSEKQARQMEKYLKKQYDVDELIIVPMGNWI